MMLSAPTNAAQRQYIFHLLRAFASSRETIFFAAPAAIAN
jgi:hypothetical protein